jgi:hypothetical protein
MSHGLNALAMLHQRLVRRSFLKIEQTAYNLLRDAVSSFWALPMFERLLRGG